MEFFRHQRVLLTNVQERLEWSLSTIVRSDVGDSKIDNLEWRLQENGLKYNVVHFEYDFAIEIGSLVSSPTEP